MTRVIVASLNPVKIAAARHAFIQCFGEEMDVTGCSVDSGVNDQPMSNEETLQGALTRMNGARAQHPDADFWVGIEGGIHDEYGGMSSFAWVTIRSGNRIGKGRSGTFFVPPPVAQLVREGKELGEADDIVFNRSNSKQENGAVGILTNNLIDRTQLYEHAILLAMIPFLQPELY
ncbi:MAG: inosine/xanthosine triphosphatase [Anaerolineaceae bacterium]|nr:inosine/xanthosine triphosphatase [Anaerolineaceae bacterium]